MERGNGTVMVYRFSWIAGLATIAFSFWELTQLLRPSVATTRWEFVVLAGFLLGSTITWIAVSYRLHGALVILLNAAVLFLGASRYLAPEHTLVIVPTPDGFGIIGREMAQAWDLIQFGVEPVLPFPGLIVIVTGLFWTLGALLVWGLLKSRPFVALIPPLVVALQLATVDRVPTGLGRIAAFILLVAAAIMAVNADERDVGAGRMVRVGNWPGRTSTRPAPSALALLAGTIVAALFLVGLLNPLVPRDGLMTWRTSSGLTGGFYGSVSYNPFVSIQKGLAANSETVVFRASIEGDVDPEEVYFRLLSLETYGGGQWYATNGAELSSINEPVWEVSEQAYVGPKSSVEATVLIEALGQDWLPAPYAPVQVTAATSRLESSIRVREVDAALAIPGSRTAAGDSFTVVSAVPALDVAALASTGAGVLSPLFATAAGADELVPTPVADLVSRELEDRERYVELPSDIDGRIGTAARSVTANLQTPFEQGLALEKWFREAGGFTYSTDVTPGHEADTLASWLFDEDNPDRRVGYCEQFAASMGVMARTLGIPTRIVLGFTPGTRLLPDSNQVIVRDKNAHAWVELWIPTQGWVSFDPTPRSDGANPSPTFSTLENELGFDVTAYLADVPAPPPIEAGGAVIPQGDRPTESNPFFGGGGDADPGPGLPSWVAFAVAMAIILLLLTAALPMFKWIRRRRRMRRLEQGDVTAAWEDIVTRLGDFGSPPSPANTPLEAAAEVDEAMRPLAMVYTRSLYSDSGSSSASELTVATESLRRTRATLDDRHTLTQRVVARYRLGSVRLRRRPKL